MSPARLTVSDTTKRALEAFSVTGEIRADKMRRRDDGLWDLEVDTSTIDHIRKMMSAGETVDDFIQRLIAKGNGSIQ